MIRLQPTLQVEAIDAVVCHLGPGRQRGSMRRNFALRWNTSGSLPKVPDQRYLVPVCRQKPAPLGCGHARSRTAAGSRCRYSSSLPPRALIPHNWGIKVARPQTAPDIVDAVQAAGHGSPNLANAKINHLRWDNASLPHHNRPAPELPAGQAARMSRPWTPLAEYLGAMGCRSCTPSVGSISWMASWCPAAGRHGVVERYPIAKGVAFQHPLSRIRRDRVSLPPCRRP